MAREKMKDSGIEWIGEIPVEWGRGKIGQFADFYNGDRTSRYPQPSEFVDNGVPFINSTNINNDFLDITECKYITEQKYGSLSGAKIMINDILFCLRGSVGKCAINNDLNAGTIASSLMAIRPKGIDAKFLLYCLLSDVSDQQTKMYMNGTCAANLSAENVSKYIIPIPSFLEQRSIASFLDVECSNIDSVMEQTRASIEEYKKLKQAVITQAVTKGIRPDRPMKDSGVEWIETIPEDWEIVRGKALFTEVNNRSEDGSEELLTVSQYTGVTPRSQKNVNMFEAETLEGYKICEIGDIPANTMWLWAGAIGVSEYRGVISPSYNIYRQNTNCFDSHYLDSLLRAVPLVQHYESLSTGIRASRLRLYPQQFLNIRFPVPPLEEQREIVFYLQEKTKEIDNLIIKKEKAVEELDSYKKSLIYEYVTGKKEVPA